MISIVVCSVNDTVFQQFSKSVELTIGLPYEIIKIDNSKGEYSICKAYNKGVTLCRYDIICFAHEDLIFETADWGKILAKVFQDPSIGLAGLLGSCYFSLFPNNWLNENEFEGQWRGPTEKDEIRRHVRFSGSDIAEVVAVDGMFLASTKKVLSDFRFSEDLLKGFHGYDMDISMQIFQKYKIVVLRNILVLHLSGGTFNDDYFNTMVLLSQKWFHHLPVYVPAYTKKEVADLKIKTVEKYFQYSSNRSFKQKVNGLRYATRHGVLIPWLKQKVRVGSA